jgi:peptidoglycan hydrolase CwlO-like protein
VKVKKVGEKLKKKVLLPIVVCIILLMVSIGGNLWLWTSLNQANSEITSLETTVSTKSSEIENLEASISTKNSVIDTKNSEIETLKSEVTTLQTSKSQLESQVTTLQADKSSLETQVSSLETENNQLQTWLDGNITNYESNLTAKDAQIESLNTQIASLNAQISSLNSQISSLNSQIAALQNETKWLEYEIDVLRGPEQIVVNYLEGNFGFDVTFVYFGSNKTLTGGTEDCALVAMLTDEHIKNAQFTETHEQQFKEGKNALQEAFQNAEVFIVYIIEDLDRNGVPDPSASGWHEISGGGYGGRMGTTFLADYWKYAEYFVLQ